MASSTYSHSAVGGWTRGTLSPLEDQFAEGAAPMDTDVDDLSQAMQTLEVTPNELINNSQSIKERWARLEFNVLNDSPLRTLITDTTDHLTQAQSQLDDYKVASETHELRLQVGFILSEIKSSEIFQHMAPRTKYAIQALHYPQTQ